MLSLDTVPFQCNSVSLCTLYSTYNRYSVHSRLWVRMIPRFQLSFLSTAAMPLMLRSGSRCHWGYTMSCSARCLNADMAEEFPLLQAELPHCMTHDFLWWQMVNCSSTSLDAADQALCDASEASLEIACKHAWHMRLCLSV